MQNARKRKDGRIEKRITVNGQRVSIYARSMKELREKENAKRAEIASGAYLRDSALTVDRYFSEWITHREKELKPATILNYETIYRNHIKPRFGREKIRKVERRAVKLWYDGLLETMKPGTAGLYLSVFSALLEDATREEVIQRNPAKGIKKTRSEDSGTHRALTAEEARALLDALKKEPLYYHISAFMLMTGTRFGEAAALTWGDIDRAAQVIHITKTATRDAGGTWTTGTPKTRTSRRDIPLTAEAAALLDETRGRVRYLPDRYIFTLSGGMINNVNMNAAIERARKRAEKAGTHIDPVTSHSFRRTFATRFYSQTKDAQALKHILGHSSYSMTMDLYAEQMQTETREQMQRVKIIG